MIWTRITPLAAALSQPQTPLQIGNLNLLLVNDNGHLHLIENRCSHNGKPLFKGKVKAGEISCLYHGATFRLEDGQPLTSPACLPIQTYRIRIHESFIEAIIPFKEK